MREREKSWMMFRVWSFQVSFMESFTVVWNMGGGCGWRHWFGFDMMNLRCQLKTLSRKQDIQLEVGASAILSPYSLTTQQVGDLTALKLSILILLSNKFNHVIFIEYYVYSRPYCSWFQLRETGKKYINNDWIIKFQIISALRKVKLQQKSICLEGCKTL